MFLSVEWAKRWLPAAFLLLSLFLPWWTFIRIENSYVAWLDLSFPWGDRVSFFHYPGRFILGDYDVRVYQIPYVCFVSALILVAGLCGLTDKSRTRTLGGLLGIAGVVSYFILVFHKHPMSMTRQVMGQPYFGIAHGFYWRSMGGKIITTHIWFLSIGFYLAIVGSLMLLLPLIRTFIERLRKRQ